MNEIAKYRAGNDEKIAHWGSFHRRYVGPDDPVPFMGVVESLSFQLSNMGLGVARLDWFDESGGVVVTRIGEEEIVETYGGGIDYYILMIPIGAIHRYWKLPKKGNIKEVLCGNDGKSNWYWRSAWYSESHSFYPCTWVLNEDGSKKSPKQRKPSKTMEWISSTYFLPHLDKEAQYKRSLLQSWDEEIDYDSGGSTIGINWYTAYLLAGYTGGDAHRNSSGSNAQTVLIDLVSYILTQPLSAHEDVMSWSYTELSQNDTWDINIYAEWIPNEDAPGGGSWSWTGTTTERTHSIVSNYIHDNTIAIGDHKRAGNILTSAGSEENEVNAEQIVPGDGTHTYVKQETKTTYNIDVYSALMYGVHEVWPATQIITTSSLSASYSGPLSPEGWHPASTSYAYDYAGNITYAIGQIGNGDDEWLFFFAVGTYHYTATGGNRIYFGGYSDVNTGQYGSWDLSGGGLNEAIEEYWVSFRTLKAVQEYENGNADFADIDTPTLKRKNGIVSVLILSEDLSLNFYDRVGLSWYKGADIDTHFIILFKAQTGEYYDRVYFYQLLVVNKLTGLHELIDLGTSAEWGQDTLSDNAFDVLIKGIGKVKYKYTA